MIADLGSMLMLYRTVDVAITYRPLATSRAEERKSYSEEVVRSRTADDSALRMAMVAVATLSISAALILRLRRAA
jgi:hypothetical protein